MRSETLWYAIKVRTRAEERIAQHIAVKGYGVYVPTYLEMRQYSDRVRRTPVALFPGYVFCDLDIRQRLPILTIPGVEGFVSFGGEPTPVPNTELNAVKGALDSGLGAHPCEYLKLGDKVRVQVGPMRGVEGILSREKTRSRLILSVHLLQRSLAVEVEREWLELIDKERRPLQYSKLTISF